MHYYQAGAPADCLKHLTLCALLEHVVQEAESFAYIDTHAGSGLYDLGSEEAMRFQNYLSGFGALANAEDFSVLRTMQSFSSIVRRTNLALGENVLRYYPGSPAIAQHFLRPQDSAWMCEASSKVVGVLRDSLIQLQHAMGSTVSTTVMCRNSYELFARDSRALPSSERVAALVDPPYDSASSSDKWNLFLVKQLTMRWPASCVLLWYPCISDLQTSLSSDVFVVHITRDYLPSAWRELCLF